MDGDELIVGEEDAEFVLPGCPKGMNWRAKRQTAPPIKIQRTRCRETSVPTTRLRGLPSGTGRPNNLRNAINANAILGLRLLTDPGITLVSIQIVVIQRVSIRPAIIGGFEIYGIGIVAVVVTLVAGEVIVIVPDSKVVKLHGLGAIIQIYVNLVVSVVIIVIRRFGLLCTCYQNT